MAAGSKRKPENHDVLEAFGGQLTLPDRVRLAVRHEKERPVHDDAARRQMEGGVAAFENLALPSEIPSAPAATAPRARRSRRPGCRSAFRRGARGRSRPTGKRPAGWSSGDDLPRRRVDVKRARGDVGDPEMLPVLARGDSVRSDEHALRERASSSSPTPAAQNENLRRLGVRHVDVSGGVEREVVEEVRSCSAAARSSERASSKRGRTRRAPSARRSGAVNPFISGAAALTAHRRRRIASTFMPTTASSSSAPSATKSSVTAGRAGGRRASP